MPFGLCNTPATFERLMEPVLRGLTYDACLVYLNDVIVGRTFQEQFENLQNLFQRIRKAHLKLNPEGGTILETYRITGRSDNGPFKAGGC
jgi:hypothetical protein